MTQATPEIVVAQVQETTVVLAGRQNSGKTSLLMHLTGATQHPVNFPGTSVERQESQVLVGTTLLRAVDLPGIMSLSALSKDEEVALRFLKEERADVLCVVLDAVKLSIELRLLRQLLELGLPVVVALNKNDVAKAIGRKVDVALLADELGLPVVETNALQGDGVDTLRTTLIEAATKQEKPKASAALADPDGLANKVQSPAKQGMEVPTLTARLDAVLLHRVFGLPLMALILFVCFEILFLGADPLAQLLEAGQEALCNLVRSVLSKGALQSFLTDGLIKGVGSVFLFLPQIVLLVALIAVLEASGYMARAAFVLDRLLSSVGLSGRSFVPLMTSFGCAVPGVLATRIIDNQADRLATLSVAPLMSCSARLPVYVLLIGAFFSPKAAPLILFSLYGLGISLAALVAFLLRRSSLSGRWGLLDKNRSVFAMELPCYQRPSLRVVLSQVLSALREFVVLAGTIIFATAIVIWLLSYYPRPASVQKEFAAKRIEIQQRVLPKEEQEELLQKLERKEETQYLSGSYLASIGRFVQPVFALAGFDWRITIGILAAFPARENIIPTLGILYTMGKVEKDEYDGLSHLTEDANKDSLRKRLTQDGGLSPLSAFALMVFFALCSQCAGTLAAIRRETRSIKWPVFVFVYMTSLSWVFSVLVYQVGKALGYS